MGWIRDLVRAEVAATLRPEFEAVRDEMQRSLHDASDGLRQQIGREHDQTRRQILEQQAELGERTRQIVEAVSQMHARLDAHRSAQQTQLQALAGTVHDLTLAIGPATAPQPTIVAGSIEPTTTAGTAGEDDHSNEIDLTERFGPGTLVEARSRFGDTWLEGLEIAETVEETGGGTRYRLARQRDGRTLPLLFAAADLRLTPLPEFQTHTS